MGEKYIILVDDSMMWLQSLLFPFNERFNKEGFDVSICESGEEALDLMREIEEKNSLVYCIVTDQAMSGMSGDVLLADVHVNYPDTVKIMLTGNAKISDVSKVIRNANLFSVIEKPSSPEEIIGEVAKGIGSYQQNIDAANDKKKVSELASMLRQTNKRLEKAVEERTSELEKSNTKLGLLAYELEESNEAREAKIAELEAKIKVTQLQDDVREAKLETRIEQERDKIGSAWEIKMASEVNKIENKKIGLLILFLAITFCLLLLGVKGYKIDLIFVYGAGGCVITLLLNILGLDIVYIVKVVIRGMGKIRIGDQPHAKTENK